MTEIGARFGPYRLLRLLGRGGMAEVYLAERVDQPGAPLAVKRILPHLAENQRFVAMLRDEAHIAAAIRHPNVGAVLDFGSADGQHYLAMEYIDGVDLGRVLRRLRQQQARAPLGAALYVGRCVARGLHAAHELRDAAGRPQRVIHRDVSPHNILVSHAGDVKLIDFGVAKARTNSTKTRSGVIKGKLQYMSPEQAQAFEVDPRSDVFALGMTLYKIITGRLPFAGRTEYQIYDQILRRPPPPPRHWVPDLPERVEAIIMRALRKAPEGRFQTAAEMADVLEVALAEIHPQRGYGAPDLSALLGQALRGAGDETEPEDAEDDEAVAPVSDPRAVGAGLDAVRLDDAAVDRLTRVAHLTRMEPGLATAVLDEGALPLPPTMIAHVDPPLPPTVVASLDGSALPRTVASARPSSLGAVPSAFQAAITAPHIPLESGELSTPSLQTEHLPRRDGGRRWAVLGLMGIAAGVILGLGIASMDQPVAQPSPEAAMAVKPTADVGTVAAVPVDAGAPPVVVAARPPPPEEDAALPPPPRLEPPVRRPVVVRTPKPRPRVVKKAVGRVTLNALPWAYVEIDGRRLAANTPIRAHALGAGPHEVTLISPDGRRWSRRVTIKAGETAKVVHDFR